VWTWTLWNFTYFSVDVDSVEFHFSVDVDSVEFHLKWQFYAKINYFWSTQLYRQILNVINLPVLQLRLNKDPLRLGRFP